MAVPMDNSVAPSSWELAECLYKKNIELETNLRKYAKSRVPSNPNTWFQIRENYESIILQDHDFSEKHDIELALWQLHYRRIEEFRTLLNAVKSSGSVSTEGGRTLPKPDSVKKIRSGLKTFLSESTGFYHDLILKIKANFGLPLGLFSDGPESQTTAVKDEKKSADMKKGLMSCHRSLIYLGDLARYKGSYGEGDSINREFGAASSYYTQAASLYPSRGNPHHQLAILASYSGDELVSIYRYFRSLAADIPFSTARDNLIIAFEKNRQIFSLLPTNHGGLTAKPLSSRTNGRGRGRADARPPTKGTKPEPISMKERELNNSELLKSFVTRFVRVNGILFTRTSLETFGEVFSSAKSDLLVLLSSGSGDEFKFGQDATENGLLIVRLIAILIFTVHNVNKESDGQSYAEILQRTVLLENAYTAAFEFTGNIIERCRRLQDVASSFLLPAIVVFTEWLACHQDIAAGPSSDAEEKQAAVRSFFWNQLVSLLNSLTSSGLLTVDKNEDETFLSDASRYNEEETGNRLALWEDFELRGFVPLVPAHSILDFSRKHSVRSEKDKQARVQRLFAAASALMNVVRVDKKAIYFDARLKKFVIGVEPEKNDYMPASLSEAPKFNAIESNPISATVHQKAQIYEDEDDDEEEEIVFKPAVAEKYPITNASTSISVSIHQASTFTQETVQPTQTCVQETVQPTQTCVQETTQPTQTCVQETIQRTQTCVQDTTQPTQQPIQIPYRGKHTNFSAQLPAPGAPLGNFQLGLAAANQSLQPLQNVNLNTSKWLMEQASILSNALKNNHSGNGVGLHSMQPEHTPQLGNFSQQALHNMNLNASNWAMEQATLSNSLTNLNINRNRYLADHAVQGSLSSIAYSPIISKVVEPSTLVSRMPSRMTSTSTTLPNASLKAPINKPTRHLGPPPGFKNIPSKQLEESKLESIVDGNTPPTDDYRWLDEYQPLPVTASAVENAVNNVAFNNSAVKYNGAMDFPFPGKQNSNVPVQMVNDKWKDFHLFEHVRMTSEPQKPAMISDQHQPQTLWPPKYHV